MIKMRKVFAIVLLAACGDAPTDPPAGGATTSTSNTGGGGAGGTGGTGGQSSTGAGGTGSACDDGKANGTCSEAEFASDTACLCEDCATTALCIVDQCINDGACTLKDACTCEDCDSDPFCSESCTIDGSCDSFTEGCACVDCVDHPHCLDNVSTGGGGSGGEGGVGGNGTGGNGTGGGSGGGGNGTGGSGGGGSGSGGNGTGGSGGGGAAGSGGSGGSGGGGGSVPVGCGVSGTGSCVELPPVGWSGPIIAYEGSATAPSCTGAYGTEVFWGYSALDCGTHTCSPCSCGGTPLGGTCNASPDVTLYEGPNCTGFFNHFTGATSGCYVLSSSVGGSSGRATIDVAVGASCAPANGGLPATQVPSWDNEALLCAGALDQLGCEVDEACAETPTAPFGAAVCIATLDVHECPAGSAYSTRYLYYSDYSDSRACSANCSCSASNKACSNVVNIIQDFCSDPGDQLPADGACHNGGFFGNGFNSTVGTPVDGTGTCNPSGSVTPTGTCVPRGGVGQGAVTVCCL